MNFQKVDLKVFIVIEKVKKFIQNYIFKKIRSKIQFIPKIRNRRLVHLMFTTFNKIQLQKISVLEITTIKI